MKSILSLSIIFLFILNSLSILPVYASVSNPSIIQIGTNNGIYISQLIVNMSSTFSLKDQVYIGISLVSFPNTAFCGYSACVNISIISSTKPKESLAPIELTDSLTACGGHQGHPVSECFTDIYYADFSSTKNKNLNQVKMTFVGSFNASVFVFETFGYSLNNGYGLSGGISSPNTENVLVGSKNTSINNPFHVTAANDFVFGVVAMGFSTNGIWSSPESYYTIIDNSNTGVVKYSTILPGTSPGGYYTNVALDSSMGDGWAESAIFVGSGYLS